MELLIVIARVTSLAVGFGFTGIVAYRMMTGRIRLTGIVTDQKTRRLSLPRLQLVLFTLGGAFIALLGLFHSVTTHEPFHLEVPEYLLVLVGSQGYYLRNKYSFESPIRRS